MRWSGSALSHIDLSHIIVTMEQWLVPKLHAFANMDVSKILVDNLFYILVKFYRRSSFANMN